MWLKVWSLGLIALGTGILVHQNFGRFCPNIESSTLTPELFGKPGLFPVSLLVTTDVYLIESVGPDTVPGLITLGPYGKPVTERVHGNDRICCNR